MKTKNTTRNHIRYTLECVACHEQFIASRKDAKTCNLACRQQKMRKGVQTVNLVQPKRVKTASETWLYRAYDSYGTLLYVGITSAPKDRMLAHRQNSVWWEDKANMTWERFTSRSDALANEAFAIQNEYPVFNVCGKRS